ncbi:MAG: YbaK/prolyl-tRNA synthetase associated domain-containing protein [Aestuariivirga sp.]|uniref:YbaK/EbsC family protein n=1 Tax=Aestuariivirga sp. TaxID=2650926 RepID=UPI0025BC1381|nr:YbaK/EbsC family protein [Aestuariivirga sp.]MCA3560010.1 YbaK/prolyl-tRNA synthetase associated domain-containing protein [Aestuariivirga sp.]
MSMRVADIDDYAHRNLMSRLRRTRIPVQTLSHSAEGNTVRASEIRRHRIEDAAKSIVVRVKLGRKDRLYAIAIVCGHQRVDLVRVARCFGGIEARFADQKTTETLTRCVSGCVMPIAQNAELLTVADYGLLDRPLLWFNSGRLDHSVALRPQDWLALAAPYLDHIAECRTPPDLRAVG